MSPPLGLSFSFGQSSCQIPCCLLESALTLKTKMTALSLSHNNFLNHVFINMGVPGAFEHPTKPH